MRIAVIDVGTNTSRLYIARVEDGQIREEVFRESQVTRLGAGVDASGRLSEEALEREYLVFDRYHSLMNEYLYDRAVAVMTSAVRDAANGQQLADDISDHYGIPAHIINGEEEARLTYLGATDQLDAEPNGAPTLVFDIGGGSTELVLGHGSRIDFHVSTQAGVVRQADRHIDTDPPTGEELEAVAQDVRQALEQAVPQEHRVNPGRALGVAGTPTSLAAIAQHLDPYDPAKVHGFKLTAAQRDAIFARLAALPLEQRKQVTGLHPDRAIAILPGIVILTEIMRLFALEQIEVSEHDILRGAALHYAAGA